MFLFIIQLIVLVIVVAIAFWLIDQISFPKLPAIVLPLIKLIIVLVALFVLYSLAVSFFHLSALH